MMARTRRKKSVVIREDLLAEIDLAALVRAEGREEAIAKGWLDAVTQVFGVEAIVQVIVKEIGIDGLYHSMSPAQHREAKRRLGITPDRKRIPNSALKNR